MGCFVIDLNEYYICICVCFLPLSLQTVGCMPPPVSSAVILTKAVGGNEVSWLQFCFINCFLKKMLLCKSFLSLRLTDRSWKYHLRSHQITIPSNAEVSLLVNIMKPWGYMPFKLSKCLSLCDRSSFAVASEPGWIGLFWPNQVSL